MSRTTWAQPAWLEPDAVEDWNELAPSCRGRGVDPTAVAALCASRSRWRSARVQLDRIEAAGASFWTDSNGDRHPNPLLALEAFLANQVREMTVALGLEPEGRLARRPTRILFLDEGETVYES